MSDIRLSRDADALICVLYKEFIRRRKSGESKQRARNMGGSPEIHRDLLPKWSFEDVDETCRELSRAGLINCSWADDIAFLVFLSDAGIVYMENRFKDGLASVLEHLETLRSFIPL